MQSSQPSCIRQKVSAQFAKHLGPNAMSENFVSIVVVLDSPQSHLEPYLLACQRSAATVADTYELIVVNCSQRPSPLSIRPLPEVVARLPNVQLLQMQESVPFEVGAWAGLERCLGGCILVTDATPHDLTAANHMLSLAKGTGDFIYPTIGFRLWNDCTPAYLPRFFAVNRHFICCAERLVNPVEALRKPQCLIPICAFVPVRVDIPAAIPTLRAIWVRSRSRVGQQLRHMEPSLLRLSTLMVLIASIVPEFFGPEPPIWVMAAQAWAARYVVIVAIAWAWTLSLRLRAWDRTLKHPVRNYTVVDSSIAIQEPLRELNVVFPDMPPAVSSLASTPKSTQLPG